ncbi:hypothetical protein BDB01DRAFT_802753 [Pilobolus umbonatus]|nr:hypothetical protein BDB01DRAFT_802753 [Pilobolus umbonatus]
MSEYSYSHLSLGWIGVTVEGSSIYYNSDIPCFPPFSIPPTFSTFTFSLPMPNHSGQFVVKRKQVNFGLLEAPISRTSSQQSFYKSIPALSESKLIYDQLIKEKNDRLNELKKQLSDTEQELQVFRHKYKLMENERIQYETTIKERYSSEKEVVALELKVLKESHVTKIQQLSTSLNQLHTMNQQLRHTLIENNIPEESWNQQYYVMEDYKKDAEFIMNAYHTCNKDSSYGHPLWSSIQNSTYGIKQEINTFEAWKAVYSIPIDELAKLLKEDKPYSMKRLFMTTSRKKN